MSDDRDKSVWEKYGVISQSILATVSLLLVVLQFLPFASLPEYTRAEDLVLLVGQHRSTVGTTKAPAGAGTFVASADPSDRVGLHVRDLRGELGGPGRRAD